MLINPPNKFNIRNPDFYPVNSRSNVMDVFQDWVEADLRKINVKKGCKNLNQSQLKAIKALQANEKVEARRQSSNT